jgi:1-acyl-sn-glycerol-3-phosphate acyltransferase
VREGLAWLGRAPWARSTPAYRIARVAARVALQGACGFRVDAEGHEILPSGGYMLVGATHRGWMDPFLVLHALPPAPRAWFLGGAATAFDRPWKEWLLRTVGGMLPVWRGGVGVDHHVAAARAVIDAGAVFVMFPEGGIAGPPDRPSTFRHGTALIALRTDPTIVPFAMAGSAELYRGKRFATRILPATSVRGLLGAEMPALLPEPGSREELALARLLTSRLEALLAPAVADLHPRTVDPPTRKRRWTGLTWLFVGRPRTGGGEHRP